MKVTPHCGAILKELQGPRSLRAAFRSACPDRRHSWALTGSYRLQRRPGYTELRVTQCDTLLADKTCAFDRATPTCSSLGPFRTLAAAWARAIGRRNSAKFNGGAAHYLIGRGKRDRFTFIQMTRGRTPGACWLGGTLGCFAWLPPIHHTGCQWRDPFSVRPLATPSSPLHASCCPKAALVLALLGATALSIDSLARSDAQGLLGSTLHSNLFRSC